MEIKNFTESNFEFDEIARLYNLVSHDDTEHVDDIKDSWAIKDKDRQRDRLFLYDENTVLGYLGYAQGRDENCRNCYFNIFLDPQYNGNGYRQLLYERMLEEIQTFACNRLYADIYEHPNYDHFKKSLLNNNFYIGLKIRESSLQLENINLIEYNPLLKKLDAKGIQFYDAKNEMLNFSDHYKKLEELQWKYGKDFPMPKGIAHTRNPFEQYMKYQKLFEEKLSQLNKVSIIPSHSNFMLIKFDNKDGSQVHSELLNNGIVVRDVSSTKGLEKYIRINIGLKDENVKLLKAFEDLI